MRKVQPSAFETREFQSRPLPPPPYDENDQPEGEPLPRRRKILSCFFIVLIVVITSCTTIIARSNNNFFVGVKNGFIIRQLTHIIGAGKYELKGEGADRINFLLMGIGGPGHEGPYLTDTIMIASFKPSTKEAALFSVPRDLIIPTGENYLKANSVYALHLKLGIDQAFAVVKEAFSASFGIPIQYMGVVDFQGFIELIDTIGGISVDVDRAFTDSLFPTQENATQVVSFQAGPQKMNGDAALKFVRSRHGNNGEGSDFARSKRQQKVILATKEKLAGFNTLINPRKITTLFNLVNQYTKTDIEPWEVVKLMQMTKDIDTDNIYNFVLDDQSGYLISGISSIDGAYILQPATGDYKQLQSLMRELFMSGQMKKEEPKIIIQNGTTIPSHAATVAQHLETLGIEPTAVGNAATQDHLSSILYDYSEGKNPATRKYLETWLGTHAQTKVPLELLPYTLARELNLQDKNGNLTVLDFLIILGQDVTTAERREIIKTLGPSPTSTQAFATSTLPDLNTDE